MSFPRYPAYKDSGVEWLDEVPEHWEALQLRRLIREVTSGTSVNAIDEPASPGQAGVLKTSCVYTGEFRPEENKAILESELYRATCTVVAGSLVVSRIPRYQERCHPSYSQTRGLDGAEQCVVTARRSRLMSEGG
jgi:type I restriction enzyme S subunit